MCRAIASRPETLSPHSLSDVIYAFAASGAPQAAQVRLWLFARWLQQRAR
jgi:hypothetical protein